MKNLGLEKHIFNASCKDAALYIINEYVSAKLIDCSKIVSYKLQITFPVYHIRVIGVIWEMEKDKVGSVEVIYVKYISYEDATSGLSEESTKKVIHIR